MSIAIQRRQEELAPRLRRPPTANRIAGSKERASKPFTRGQWRQARIHFQNMAQHFVLQPRVRLQKNARRQFEGN